MLTEEVGGGPCVAWWRRLGRVMRRHGALARDNSLGVESGTPRPAKIANFLGSVHRRLPKFMVQVAASFRFSHSGREHGIYLTGKNSEATKVEVDITISCFSKNSCFLIDSIETPIVTKAPLSPALPFPQSCKIPTQMTALLGLGECGEHNIRHPSHNYAPLVFVPNSFFSPSYFFFFTPTTTPLPNCGGCA